MDGRALDIAIKKFARELTEQYDRRIAQAVEDAAAARVGAEKAKDAAASAKAGMQLAEQRLQKALASGAEAESESARMARNDAGSALAAAEDLTGQVAALRRALDEGLSGSRDAAMRAVARRLDAEEENRRFLQAAVNELPKEQDQLRTALARELSGRVDPLEKLAAELSETLTLGMQSVRKDMQAGFEAAHAATDRAVQVANEAKEAESPKTEQLASMRQRVDGMVAQITEIEGIVAAVKAQGHPALRKASDLEVQIGRTMIRTQQEIDGLEKSQGAAFKRIQEEEARLRTSMQGELEGQAGRLDQRVTDLFAELDAKVGNAVARLEAIKNDGDAIKAALANFGQAA